MEVSNQIQLKFHGVDFPIINLNSDIPFYHDGENSITIEITPKVFYPREQIEFFKIIQENKISSDKHFSLFILAVGTFELKADLDENIKKSFVNINAPAIMFPYIRAFISTLTANLGNIIGPLIIPTQFFIGELEIISEITQ